MNAARLAQLLEAAQWLRLSGDTQGAKRIYEQILDLDPGNEVARDFLEGRTSHRMPLPTPPAISNPFARTDAKKGETQSLYTSDWGAFAGTAPSFELSWESSEAPEPLPEQPEAPQPPARFESLAFEEPGAAADPLMEIDAAAAASRENAERFTNSLFTPAPTDSPNAWDGPEGGAGASIELAPVEEGHDALDLVAESAFLTSSPTPAPLIPAAVRSELESLLGGARDLLTLDDHSGAMDLLLKAEAMAPEDPQVKALKAQSEDTLLSMFESKIGDLARRPRVVLKEDDVIWLNLDHRAGFVLAQIDGQVSFEDLFALSGMSRFDTARILAQLLEEGVITP